MITVEGLRFIAFCESAREFLAQHGFRILILLVARDADAPHLYDDLKRYWVSLDDITGPEIAFVLAVDGSSPTEFSSDIGHYAIANSADVLFETSSRKFYHEYRDHFGVAPSRETLADGQSGSISALRRYLGLTEADVPCLHLTLLEGPLSVETQISLSKNSLSLYSICKAIATSMQGEFAKELASIKKRELAHAKLNNERKILSELRKSAADHVSVHELLEHAECLRKVAPEEEKALLDELLQNCRRSPHVGELRPSTFRILKSLKDRPTIPKNSFRKLQKLIDIVFDRKGIPHADPEVFLAIENQAGIVRMAESDANNSTYEIAESRKELRKSFVKLKNLTDDAIIDRGWDYFLSYPSPASEYAEKVAQLLSQRGNVFFDKWSIKVGRSWTELIPLAQAQSRCTVVLITKDTHKAHYQISEIQSAVKLKRSTGHTIVPIFLEQNLAVPYGLEQISSLTAESDQDLSGLFNLIYDE